MTFLFASPDKLQSLPNCKEVMADNHELVNIMTDMTGSFNKVVMVTKYD